MNSLKTLLGALTYDSVRQLFRDDGGMGFAIHHTKMPLIELETMIEAPPGRVFDLARSIDAHMASTEGSDERAIDGRTSGLIEMGETVTWEARHFGVRQRFTVRIVAMDRPHAFCDEMVSGAFASMKHFHRFLAVGAGTLMKDEFHFAAPLGLLGRMAERMFLTRYMTGFLSTRSRALKMIAETDEWRRYLAEGEDGGGGNPAQGVPPA